MQGSITSQGDNDDDDLMTTMTMTMITMTMTMTMMITTLMTLMIMIIVSFLNTQSDGQFNILPNELDVPAQLRQNQVNFRF